MTKAATDSLSLSWLHCNDCHRAFDSHNRLEAQQDGRLQVVKSDLVFSFTSCGHFFCENCVEQATDGDGRFKCKVCGEASAKYKVEGRIAKNLEMYMKPPVSMLEDAVGVMLFQLNNANQLIKSLRSKVAQQKDLLGKAKQELTGHKTLKEKVAQLTAENAQLKSKISNFISDSQDIQESSKNIIVKEKLVIPQIPASPIVPNIKVNGRLSLKSPIMSTPPTFKRQNVGSSAESFRGGYNPAFYGAPQEPPHTPISAMWNPPFRQHPNVGSFPPLPPPPLQQHQTPTRHFQMGQPQPQQVQYYGPPSREYQQPPSTFGSPRPYYRNGSSNNNNTGYAPY